VKPFVRGYSEIVLIVEDVEAAARFYREVVRLEPQTEPHDGWAWFWVDQPDGRQRLALHRGSLLFEEHSPHPPGARFGHVHFAFEVPREDFEEAAEHVRSHGVEVFGPTRFDWMRATSYYFYDLDGNLLELWSPDPS
jgi:catechol 2,3-dioxygenase-like lactoylglutathione lyase family enzyme